VLDSLTTTPETRRHALEIQAEIEAQLVACRGVTGQGIESHWLAFQSTRAEDKPLKRLKRGGSYHRFSKQCPAMESPIVEEPFWFSNQAADFEAAYTSDDQWSLTDFRHKFHQLLYGEVETTDRMGKMLAEFPDLPWELRMDLAHQMWDEARHIEIVAKACEEELGAQLGYGPWPLVWWWMQNEPDPLRRISVTNGWSEANLMPTLREWREKAEQRGFIRIAELADYLQADELTHVKLATKWIPLLAADSRSMDELVAWSRQAVDRIQSFYASAYGGGEPAEPRFSFLRGGDDTYEGSPSPIIGE
jgi:hypothetical protein